MWCFRLTEMVLQSPSRKFLRGVRKLMADVWRNSLSAAPNLLSYSPTSIKVLPARNRLNPFTTKSSFQIPQPSRPSLHLLQVKHSMIEDTLVLVYPMLSTWQSAWLCLLSVRHIRCAMTVKWCNIMCQHYFVLCLYISRLYLQKENLQKK